MTRGILIAGNEAPAAAAITSEAETRVQALVTALVPNRFTSMPVPELSPRRDGTENLAWNPASPISARTVVVGAENRLGRLDEAVLVCSPLAVRRRIDELAPAEVDIAVDDLMKGWFLLAREIAIRFRSRKSGTLALVLSEGGLGSGKEDAPDLLGASVAASFRAFAQGLLSASFREDYRVLAFSSSEAADDAGFAAFVFKALDEAPKRGSGKWHKYGKGSLFGIL